MQIRPSGTVWAVCATVLAAALGVYLGEQAHAPQATQAVARAPSAPAGGAQAVPPLAASRPAEAAAPCGASTQANPFAAQAPCAPARAAQVLPRQLPELQQALDSVDPCAGQGSGCRRNAHPFEAALVRQLETLALADTGSARVALALQLQRQSEREGLQASDSDQVAQDGRLQRSVALLAEAAAAGDPQALRYRESLGAQGEQLLHTGR